MNAYRQASLAIISGFLLLPLVASAENGFFMGASIGTADLNEDFDGLTIDTDSTAFRVTAGWRFNDNFVIEGGYHDFGDFEQQVDVNGTISTVSLSADGFIFGVAGALPLTGQFALTARLGMFFWDGAAEINNVSQASPEDSNLYFGAGASYALTERLALTGDWSRYDLEDAQSNVLSVGFQFQF
jgi:OOP family OmpA-OmpF porin